MANFNFKLKSNVDGPYFVDNQCLRCSGCVVYSPECFDINKEGAFLKKQPTNQEEKDACEYARKRCPAKAIGYLTHS